MIERKFVAQRIKEYQIEEFITHSLKNVGHSSTKMQKTPLGEKIVIHASRPGLIVGRKGQSIKLLTKQLKNKFNLENPQIEISEVENINFDAKVTAERIADSLERFGLQRFKAIGHKVITETIGAGAMGIEIIMSGKIPSQRARSWRFYSGYLKKSGDAALINVKRAQAIAKLKTGIIGVKVSIMPPNIILPDHVELLEEKETVIEEIKPEPAPLPEEEKKEAPKEDKKNAKKAKVKNEDKGN